MGDCINCNGNCTQLISDACVRYEGEAFKCINLGEGTFDNPVFYREAFDKLAAGFCNFLENNNVDLSCLYDGDGDPTTTVKEAVEKLIEKVCNLTTDDISATASSYSVGANASTCGAKLLNRSLGWATTNFKEGTKFTYSFSNALSNLPDNYTVNSVNVKAIGKSSGSVNTVFANTDKRTGGFNITPDRLPVVIEATANIDTTCGQISLTKKIGISSAQEGNFTTPLDINDTSSTTNFGGKNLTQYLEDQSSQISINKNELDSLKDISIQDCENVSYPSTDLQTVVQVQGAKVCESLFRLDSIGEEKVLLTSCDDQCGISTSESTLQKALDKLSEIMCQNQKEIADLKERVRVLELTVEKCCDGSASSSSSSSSSSGGGGGCVDGNCPPGSTDGNFNSGGGTGIGGGGTITGTPGGGAGDGNGNPTSCTQDPITINYSYDCNTGLSYTVTGAVGSYTVTIGGANATQGMMLADGVHVFKVVDSRGCESYSSESISCCSVDFTSTYDCDEGIVITTSGGSGNTTILIDNVNYTEGATLTNGSHTISVQDNTENCSVEKIINVNCTSTDPCESTTILITTDATDYCTDQGIDVSWAGGVAPFNISVGGVQRASGLPGSPHAVIASGFSNETVEVIVTDGNGCTGSTSVYIPACCDTSDLNLFANIPAYLCNGSLEHILNVGVTGGTAPYAITVVDNSGLGSTVYSATGLAANSNYGINTGLGAATVYEVTVTDANGCTDVYDVSAAVCV